MTIGYKVYTLDDLSMTTATEVAKKTGLEITTARSRLSMFTDPKKIYKPKKIVVDEKHKSNSYKMRKILSRGLYDEMFRLALRKI